MFIVLSFIASAAMSAKNLLGFNIEVPPAVSHAAPAVSSIHFGGTVPVFSSSEFTANNTDAFPVPEELLSFVQTVEASDLLHPEETASPSPIDMIHFGGTVPILASDFVVSAPDVPEDLPSLAPASIAIVNVADTRRAWQVLVSISDHAKLFFFRGVESVLVLLSSSSESKSASNPNFFVMPDEIELLDPEEAASPHSLIDMIRFGGTVHILSSDVVVSAPSVPEDLPSLVPASGFDVSKYDRYNSSCIDIWWFNVPCISVLLLWVVIIMNCPSPTESCMEDTSSFQMQLIPKVSLCEEEISDCYVPCGKSFHPSLEFGSASPPSQLPQSPLSSPSQLPPSSLGEDLGSFYVTASTPKKKLMRLRRSRRIQEVSAASIR